ncbi:MAG: hypothetical protein IT162_01115 [Bryobacterales bacterium]|nr:hypothetical protein [Bryobacterales bacterium]
MTYKLLLLFVLAAAMLPAQPKRMRVHSAAADLLSAPVVGYALAPESREARVVYGLPGSTHYSDPVAWPEGAASVRAAAGHRWLLALRAESAASVWVPELGAERALPLVTSEPSLIVFSPSGSAAAFYWAAEKRLVVYAGLPDAPELMAEPHTPDTWTALAVNDSGRVAVGLTEAGELRTAGELLREAHPVAAFGFSGDRLAVIDAGSDAVDIVEAGASRRLIALPAAVSAQVRLLPGGGANWFLLADAGALHRVDTTGGGSVRTTSLSDIPIDGLQALRTRGAVLLEAPAGVAPRIVLSHAEGDELFYLPTLTAETKAAVEEVQQ